LLLGFGAGLAGIRKNESNVVALARSYWFKLKWRNLSKKTHSERFVQVGIAEAKHDVYRCRNDPYWRKDSVYRNFANFSTGSVYDQMSINRLLIKKM
jgi:transketolase C-terminal domain/subunit